MMRAGTHRAIGYSTIGAFVGTGLPGRIDVMTRRDWIRATVLALGGWLTMGWDVLAAEPAAPDPRLFELRIYTAHQGKLDPLLERFRKHTCAIFARNGMTNIGYWTPIDNPDSKLYYILAYPDKAARDAAWKAFAADPEWTAARTDSEKNGALVAKVESIFLQAADFSPKIAPSAPGSPRVFELRTYTAESGRLPNLLERFRKHTVALFERHGMTNFGYWTKAAGQPGADTTLVYFLAHKSKEAGEASFKAFRSDPEWVAAKEASEKAAGGPLTVKDGVQSILMVPTDFSPAR